MSDGKPRKDVDLLLDESTAKKLETHCIEHGYIVDHFVDVAIQEKLKNERVQNVS